MTIETIAAIERKEDAVQHLLCLEVRYQACEYTILLSSALGVRVSAMHSPQSPRHLLPGFATTRCSTSR
jgi:hypothetical protein